MVNVLVRDADDYQQPKGMTLALDTYQEQQAHAADMALNRRMLSMRMKVGSRPQHFPSRARTRTHAHAQDITYIYIIWVKSNIYL